HVAAAAGSIGQVLHLPPPSVIADLDVELAVRAEADHPAVMIATQPLVAGVRLAGAEVNEIGLETQCRAVPDEAVHAIAQQRGVLKQSRISVAHCFSPKQVNA